MDLGKYCLTKPLLFSFLAKGGVLTPRVTIFHHYNPLVFIFENCLFWHSYPHYGYFRVGINPHLTSWQNHINLSEFGLWCHLVVIKLSVVTSESFPSLCKRLNQTIWKLFCLRVKVSDLKSVPDSNPMKWLARWSNIMIYLTMFWRKVTSKQTGPVPVPLLCLAIKCALIWLRVSPCSRPKKCI